MPVDSYVMYDNGKFTERWAYVKVHRGFGGLSLRLTLGLKSKRQGNRKAPDALFSCSNNSLESAVLKRIDSLEGAIHSPFSAG